MNENDVLTLAQLAEEVESQERIDIKVADFDSFANFMSYFSIHYAPLLKRLQSRKAPKTEKDRRLLAGLASDLLAAFAPDDDEADEDTTEEPDECKEMLTRAINTHTSQLYRNADAYRDQQNPEAVRACLDEIKKYNELLKQL